MKCGQRCEIFSRVTGYHRPVNNWNRGKQAEFNDRQAYSEKVSCCSERGLPKVLVNE